MRIHENATAAPDRRPKRAPRDGGNGERGPTVDKAAVRRTMKAHSLNAHAVRRDKTATAARGNAVKFSRRMCVGMATLVVIAVLWYVATTGLGLISAGRFPAPVDVETAAVQALVRGYPDTTLLIHVLHSLR